MTTQNKSRILFTVLLLPPLGIALYWLFTGAPILGLSVLVAGLAALAWVWFAKPGEKKKS